MKDLLDILVPIVGGLILLVLTGSPAMAHCDTMDGPVVTDAKAALESADVTPVLKWVRPSDEEEIKRAFEKVLAVRGKGADARELADTYFFETVVRVHRAGEGAPYTGLKPAGTKVEPAIADADKALETGSVEEVVRMVTDAVADGIRERFVKALERKKHSQESVAAGREYVAAYVDFIHYVERIHADAAGTPHAAEESAHPEIPAAHGH